MNRWKDTLGIIASVACAIHCAATPVLLAFLPALKFTEWMASPWFHQATAIVCVALVSISILPTFHRFRDYRVLGLSSVGLALVFTAAFLLPAECCSFSVSSAHRQSVSSATSPVDLRVASTDSSDTASSTDLLSKIQPWMTPLGGLLLIMAHALNMTRRLSPCGKSCTCHSHSKPNDDSALPVVLISNPKAA